MDRCAGAARRSVILPEGAEGHVGCAGGVVNPAAPDACTVLPEGAIGYVELTFIPDGAATAKRVREKVAQEGGVGDSRNARIEDRATIYGLVALKSTTIHVERGPIFHHNATAGGGVAVADRQILQRQL
jgi:hypothetical protein